MGPTKGTLSKDCCRTRSLGDLRLVCGLSRFHLPSYDSHVHVIALGVDCDVICAGYECEWSISKLDPTAIEVNLVAEGNGSHK
jgi:hypothetical protein